MENETLELIGEAIPNIKISIKAKNVYMTINQVEKEAPAVPVQEPQRIGDDKDIAYITNKDLTKIINNIVRNESDIIKISSQLGISLVHHNDA